MKKTIPQSFNIILAPLLETHKIKSILLAVSGGSDSMALLHLMNQSREHTTIPMQVAHLNHKLRGEASDRDEELLKKTCDELKIILHCEKVSAEEWENIPGTGLEEKARNKR